MDIGSGRGVYSLWMLAPNEIRPSVFTFIPHRISPAKTLVSNYVGRAQRAVHPVKQSELKLLHFSNYIVCTRLSLHVDCNMLEK